MLWTNTTPLGLTLRPNRLLPREHIPATLYSRPGALSKPAQPRPSPLVDNADWFLVLTPVAEYQMAGGIIAHRLSLSPSVRRSAGAWSNRFYHESTHVNPNWEVCACPRTPWHVVAWKMRHQGVTGNQNDRKLLCRRSIVCGAVPFSCVFDMSSLPGDSKSTVTGGTRDTASFTTSLANSLLASSVQRRIALWVTAWHGPRWSCIYNTTPPHPHTLPYRSLLRLN